jgi:hypothetical protein
VRFFVRRFNLPTLPVHPNAAAVLVPAKASHQPGLRDAIGAAQPIVVTCSRTGSANGQAVVQSTVWLSGYNKVRIQPRLRRWSAPRCRAPGVEKR